MLSHLTQKEQDDKQNLNQLKTEPLIPNHDERRVIKMSWSMVSKAAERSRGKCMILFTFDTIAFRPMKGSFSGMMFTVGRLLRIK